MNEIVCWPHHKDTLDNVAYTPVWYVLSRRCPANFQHLQLAVPIVYISLFERNLCFPFWTCRVHLPPDVDSRPHGVSYKRAHEFNAKAGYTAPEVFACIMNVLCCVWRDPNRVPADQYSRNISVSFYFIILYCSTPIPDHKVSLPLKGQYHEIFDFWFFS